MDKEVAVLFKVGEDMLLKILLSLPPKTLMRFKCVSKRWHALISSPKFVAKHLYNSEHNNLFTSVLLERLVPRDRDTNTEEQTDKVFSLLNFCNDNDDDDDGGEHSLRLSSVEDINIPPSVTTLQPRGQSLCIIGHCHGIICAEASSGEMLLWNPAIEESRLLPPEPYLPKWPETGLSEADWDKGFRYLPDHRFLEAPGFGYDSKSNDYKVVNIGFPGTQPYGDGFDLVVYPPKAVVYTLSSDTWREIETVSLETETTNLWPESFQIFFKGMCYWLGHEQSKVINGWDLSSSEYIRDVIISFDMSDEVFHDILLPDSLYKWPCFEMRLKVWDESIALFGYHNYDGIRTWPSFGIWVMDEFGGPLKNAWTKHLTFDLPTTERPLVFWNSDEILLASADERIVSYNLITKTFKYLPIQTIPDCCGTRKAVIYVKSLVSVTR